jgi:hypothetical protein
MPRIRPAALSLTILSILILSTISVAAAPDRITGPITSGQTARLRAGIPLQARHGSDEGEVDPSQKMNYITLLTSPTAAQQRALTKLLADQQTPHSASYHKWLTPEQYADRFGLSPNDVKKIADWLQSQGFTVVNTARGRNWIAFRGTAAQVENTFQTEIHNFKVNGETHFANTAAPVIPAALSGVVSGIRGLNNFRAKSQAQHAKPAYTFPVSGGDAFYLAPGDVATMYDLNTLYTNGFDGTGQRLAVIGQTDVYLDDLTDFRSGFDLNWDSNCSTNSNGVITGTNCNTQYFQYLLVTGDTDPGAPDSIGDDLPEADIDIEYSGGTARGAQIIYVNAPDPNGNGIYDSMYFAIDNTVAPVMTMSYTFPCELAEAYNGTYTSDEAEFQMANAEGITFMNSAGDTGAAECDYGNDTAVYGYAVSYPASSPEITGVGGTLIPYNEYTDTYWNTSNGLTGGSLIKYATENVWNDSQEWSIFCAANPTNPTCSGNPGFDTWQTTQEETGYIGLVAGGGGVSNCVIVDDNGVCTSGIPRPSYQSGILLSTIDPGNGGVLSTPARYSPDVSLLASIYWPGYIICTADSELGGSDNNSACSPGGAQGIINNMTNYGYSWGGTSISSPIFAGMVSMLNQYLNGSSNAGLGNINPTLYTLAATPANNFFHHVTTGSDGAWCEAGTPNSGVTGDPWPTNLVCPSSGPNTDFVGFNASNSDSTTGYNLAVGLGSVDATNLFAAWAGTTLSPTTTSLVSSENPSNFGDSVTFTATVVTTGSDTPTGTVVFNDNGTQIGTGTLGGCVCDGIVNSATATFTTSTLSSGSHPITAVYGGDSNNSGSTSNIVTQVVNAPTFTLSNPSSPGTVLSGQSTTSTFTVTATGTGVTTFAAAVNLVCNGLPDATVTCNFSLNPIPAGTASPVTETLTITTTGPNPNGGVRKQQRHADNRMPWLPMTLPLAGVVMVGIAGRKRSRYSMVASLFVSLALLGLLLACGGGSSTPPAITVSVSPSGSTLFPNDSADSWPPQTASFTATVTNSTNTSVAWSLSSSVSCTANPSPCGSIDSTGAYTAPTIATGLPSSVTVTATSQADMTKTGHATITLTPTTVPGQYSLSIQATESTTINSKGITLNVN